MSVESELHRLTMRQEAMVQAMAGLTEITGATHDLVVELMAWLQKPPSTDLRDVLAAMANAIEVNAAAVVQLTTRLATLPADVARAVTTGEVG